MDSVKAGETILKIWERRKYWREKRYQDYSSELMGRKRGRLMRNGEVGAGGAFFKAVGTIWRSI